MSLKMKDVYQVMTCFDTLYNAAGNPYLSDVPALGSMLTSGFVVAYSVTKTGIY